MKFLLHVAFTLAKCIYEICTTELVISELLDAAYSDKDLDMNFQHIISCSSQCYCQTISRSALVKNDCVNGWWNSCYACFLSVGMVVIPVFVVS